MIPKETLDAKVDHPSHYQPKNGLGMECIDIIQAFLTKEEFLGYLKGCALKYQFRAGSKGAESTDLRKAKWYIEALIEQADKHEHGKEMERFDSVADSIIRDCFESQTELSEKPLKDIMWRIGAIGEHRPHYGVWTREKVPVYKVPSDLNVYYLFTNEVGMVCRCQRTCVSADHRFYATFISFDDFLASDGVMWIDGNAWHEAVYDVLDKQDSYSNYYKSYEILDILTEPEETEEES